MKKSPKANRKVPLSAKGRLDHAIKGSKQSRG